MKKYSTLEVFEMMRKNMELEFEMLGVKCCGDYPNTIKFNKKTNTICWGGNSEQPIKISECFLNLGWKKVNKSVTFQEALNSNKKVRVEHNMYRIKEQSYSDISVINETLEYYKLNDYLSLSNMLLILTWYFRDDGVKEIIKNGKWYLQEEDSKDCQALKKKNLEVCIYE